MNNRIIKNVFSTDEVSDIKDFILKAIESRKPLTWNLDLEIEKPDLFDEYKVDSRMGRLVMENLHQVPQNIIDKVSDLAAGYNSNAKYVGATYCEYSGKYGIPKLDMHKDRGDNENICLDYQIEANISWPIDISDERYLHEDNDIIVFRTTKESHGRPHVDFAETDFVRVIFFYFICEDSNA